MIGPARAAWAGPQPTQARVPARRATASGVARTMIKKSMKLEGLLDEAELATLLESLGLLARTDADELLAPQGLKALKLSVRKRYGQIYTSLKIERDAPSPAPALGGAAEAASPGRLHRARAPAREVLEPQEAPARVVSRRDRESRPGPPASGEGRGGLSGRFGAHYLLPRLRRRVLCGLRARPRGLPPPPGRCATSPPCRRRCVRSRTASAAATPATPDPRAPSALSLSSPAPAPLRPVAASSRTSALLPLPLACSQLIQGRRPLALESPGAARVPCAPARHYFLGG